MIVDPYGARREAEVMKDTWGHLRPAPGSVPGYMLAACSVYNSGERLLINAEFPGVPDSPWLYDAMINAVESADMEEGTVYRFDGVCTTRAGQITITGTWNPVTTTRIQGKS